MDLLILCSKVKVCWIIQIYFLIIITNDKIILKQITKKLKKLYCIICGKYRKIEKPKISYTLEKTLVLSIICSKCKNEDQKIFKKKNQLKY